VFESRRGHFRVQGLLLPWTSCPIPGGYSGPGSVVQDEWAAVYLLAAPLVLAISPVVRNRPTPIGLWLRPSATDRATSASGLSFPIASHG